MSGNGALMMKKLVIALLLMLVPAYAEAQGTPAALSTLSAGTAMSDGDTFFLCQVASVGCGVSSNPPVYETASQLATYYSQKTITETNKTLTNPTINAATLSGTFAGNPAFAGNPMFVGLPSGSCSNGVALDGSSRLVIVACPGTGSGAALTTTDAVNTVTSTTQQTFGPCFVVGGAGGLATINLTQVVTSRTGADYAVNVTDGCSTIEVGVHTYTFPLGVLTPGVGVRLHNVGTSGNATINSTGGNFTGMGIANASTFALAPGQYADIASIAGPLALVQTVTGGGGVTASGTNNFTGANTFAEVHPTTDQVTLTSNNYTPVVGDCGHIKVLPTGTTPTVTLPNLNTSCVITFIVRAAVSYTFNITGSGTKINVTGKFASTAAAGAQISAVITQPSGSATEWALVGDLTL